MEQNSHYRSNEQSFCVDPQLLLFGSGSGVDDPTYTGPTHMNDDAIDLLYDQELPLRYPRIPNIHNTSASDQDADYELVDETQLTPSCSSLDPEAPVFVPMSQMELETDIRIGDEFGLEPLHPITSPPTPRIEVSAPIDFPSIGVDHTPRVSSKSRSQSRQTSPRGRSSSISRPRAKSSSTKSSPMPKAIATRLITTLENMPANRQGPYTVGDRTAALRDLHVHASFPPPMPIQYPPYSKTAALVPGSSSQGYRCNHNGCGESTRVWDTKSERDHHERKHVPNTRRAHGCDLCGMTFHFPKDLNRHVAAVHHRLRVICSYCGKAYSRKDNLDRHIKTQHKDTQSSRSDSQMSAYSPAASTPISYVQSPVDGTGHTTPLNLSPLAAKANPWSKHHHHRHDSVNDSSANDCYSPSDSSLHAQPMFKSYSNRI